MHNYACIYVAKHMHMYMLSYRSKYVLTTEEHIVSVIDFDHSLWSIKLRVQNVYVCMCVELRKLLFCFDFGSSLYDESGFVLLMLICKETVAT